MLGLGAAVAVLVATTAPALAQEEDLASPWELTTPNGKVSQSFSLFTQKVRGMPGYQERVDFELEETLTNNTLTFRAIPWVYARIPEATAGDKRRARAFVELKEGWAELATSAVDLRVGNQIFAWGAADQVNPTDVWNPRDLYDPFQNTKLPITALRMNLHPPQTEAFALELIFTPFFRESRLPFELPEGGTHDLNPNDSRWLMPLPTRVSVDGLSAPLQYRVSAPTYPRSWQLGARLKALSFGGWDFSVMGFNGVETTPRFAITRRGQPNDPALPLTLTLHPSFHRQTVLGFDGTGSVALGDMEFGTRFEAAYLKRDNSRAKTAPVELQADLTREDDLHAVAGVDYTFKRLVLGTVLYVNFMYVHYQNLGTQEHAPGQLVARGLPNLQPWDDNLVLYWENRIGSDLKFSNTALLSLDHRDGIVSPALHYGWTDNLKTSLGYDYFYGNKVGGFFSQFRDNRRLTISASYAF